MAARKRRRKKRKSTSSKLRPLYKTSITIWKNGRWTNETVAASTDRKSGISQFNQAKKGHKGAVRLEKETVQTIKSHVPDDWDMHG